MVEITFEHIPPPTMRDTGEIHYRNGWHFADEALLRHGPDACAQLRRNMNVVTSYEKGAADRFDGKPHKYGS